MRITDSTIKDYIAHLKDDILLRRNEDGIVTMGLKQFLMDEEALDL